MSRAASPETTEYTFDHGKFFAARKDLISKALTTAGTEIPSRGDRLSHLESICDEVHFLTGGNASYGDTSLPLSPDVTDKSAIFIFDILHSMCSGKKYTPAQMEHLNKINPEGAISRIEKSINHEDREISETSKNLIKSMMNWLVNESKINTLPYLADVNSAKERQERGDPTTFADEIRLGSEFAKQYQEKTCKKAVETVVGTSGITKPIGYSQLEERRKSVAQRP